MDVFEHVYSPLGKMAVHNCGCHPDLVFDCSTDHEKGLLL